jgi:hypothetical protein
VISIAIISREPISDYRFNIFTKMFLENIFSLCEENLRNMTGPLQGVQGAEGGLLWSPAALRPVEEAVPATSNIVTWTSSHTLASLTYLYELRSVLLIFVVVSIN